MAKVRVYECDICHIETRYEYNEPILVTLKAAPENFRHDRDHTPVKFDWLQFGGLPLEVCRDCVCVLKEAISKCIEKREEIGKVYNKLQD